MTRTILTAGLNLFVDPTGSDSNDGLTSVTPFQHIQHAINYVYQNIDMGYYGVNIRLATGTRTSPVIYYENLSMEGPFVGQGSLVIHGHDFTAPMDTAIIEGSGSAAVIHVSKGPTVGLGGFTVQSSGSGDLLYTAQAASIRLNGLALGHTTGNGLSADYHSLIFCQGDMFISGDMASVFCVNNNSTIDCKGNNFYIIGNRMIQNFANGQGNGKIVGYGNMFTGNTITGYQCGMYDGSSLTLAGGNYPCTNGQITGTGGRVV